jgi:hypothetical protein
VIDVEINGIQYKSSVKLNAIQQFLLSKRLVPILDVISRVARNKPDGEDLAILIADGVAKLSDDDSLYIFDLCLTGVQCYRDGVWALVWNHSAKQPQFADFDMPSMLQLTFAVLTDTLGSFMPAPAKTLPPTIR